MSSNAISGRKSRSCSVGIDIPSSTSKRTEPAEIAPGSGTIRITARQVRLLPEPDSPTRPSVSPFRIEKLTSLAACTVRSGRNQPPEVT